MAPWMRYQIVRVLFSPSSIRTTRLTFPYSFDASQFIPILLIQLLNLFWYFLILRIMIRLVQIFWFFVFSPVEHEPKLTRPSSLPFEPRSIRGVTLADDRSDDEDEGEDDDDDDEVVPTQEEKKTQ